MAEKNAPSPEKKPGKTKLTLQLALSFTVTVGLYFTMMKIGELKGNFLIQEITLFSYMGAAILLGALYVIFNKGVSSDVPKEDDLPDDWSDEKKREFVEQRKKDRAKAKKVLIFLLPVVVTLFIEIINLFYFT